MLKETYIELLTKYTDNSSLIHELWLEIEKNYTNNKRYYHTLQHLENLLTISLEIKEKINHWDCYLLTLYYHDIIYDSTQTDNEEKSAELAENRLKKLSVSSGLITLCKAQILATKSHVESTDSDTNYFTDADLSILGQTWETYSAYFKNIRKEYTIYPDSVYNPGRKKVLQHFLSMERRFKTDFFYDKFETQAQQNIQKELDMLNE